MDCSLSASSVCGILQTRILEWVVIPFSRRSWLRDWTQVSCIEGRFCHHLRHQGSPVNTQGSADTSNDFFSRSLWVGQLGNNSIIYLHYLQYENNITYWNIWKKWHCSMMWFSCQLPQHAIGQCFSKVNSPRIFSKTDWFNWSVEGPEILPF